MEIHNEISIMILRDVKTLSTPEVNLGARSLKGIENPSNLVILELQGHHVIDASPQQV